MFGSSRRSGRSRNAAWMLHCSYRTSLNYINEGVSKVNFSTIRRNDWFEIEKFRTEVGEKFSPLNLMVTVAGTEKCPCNLARCWN